MKTFKKLISLCVIGCLAATNVSAQENTFAKSDKVIGLGIGFGGNIYSGAFYGSGVKKFPAISAYFETCVKDNLWDEKSAIGVGGLVGFSSAKWDYSGYGSDYGWKQTNFIIGARGALHYAFVNKLNTYTGLMLGYNIASHKWTGDHSSVLNTNDSYGGFTWSWFIGGRYYFSPQFAAFAEIGYGIAILNIGVSYKF